MNWNLALRESGYRTLQLYRNLELRDLITQFRFRVLCALLAVLPAAALAQTLPDKPPAPEPVQRAAEIETQQLRELDAWSVGVLTTQQGALPRTMWAHADPAFLAQAFDRLPSVYHSPAVQALARRVLLSGADAPPGDANEAARKRFEALGRMGAADELSQMAAGASSAINDPAIAQFAAQAELARGRRAEACARGRAAQGDPPATFILRLRAYCAASSGDRAAADLALELARANRGEDTWVTAVIGLVGGAPSARPPAARYDTSLQAAMSVAAQLRPGANPLANASSLALVTLARAESAPQPVRAQAAAQALRRGLLSVRETRTIFVATPANVTSGVPPLAMAQRQVSAAPDSPAAAAAIAGVLRQATAFADFSAAAQFFKDEIAVLSAQDGASAALFARAALTVGDMRLAERLIESARLAGASAAAMGPLEAALAVMHGAGGDPNGMAVHRRIDAASNATARAAARDLMLMDAAGLPFDGAAQAFVTANPPQGGAHADPSAMAALSAAADRNATGEVALLAVIAANDGPARLDAPSAAAIVRTLRAARLDDDARRVVVEALLAGQPS